MKKFVITGMMLTLFLSCKKDKADLPDSSGLQQPEWESEKFKTDYTIQFPDYYSGGYHQDFYGGSFNKTRDDTRAVFSYLFSNGTSLLDFGDTLADENTDSISVEDGDVLVFLPKRMNFTQNGTIVGILFYNEVWSICRGELYWKDGGVFKDALTIYYATDLKDEMVSILKTIEHN